MNGIRASVEAFTVGHIMERVIPVLLNENSKELEYLPHVPFYGMQIVFAVYTEKWKCAGIGWLTEDNFKEAGLDVGAVFDQAVRNVEDL